MHRGARRNCGVRPAARSDASCVHGPCRQRCRADAGVQPLPVIAQDVNGFRSAPPTETDVSNRDWASCEAGAAERRLLLGSATTRECQMGTCKKRPQRDRGPRPAQVPSPCPILFCRHTASAQGPSRRPCLLDKCAAWRLPFTPPNAAANRQPIRQCAGVPATKQPEQRVSASFRRSRFVRRAYGLVRAPHRALAGSSRVPQPGCRLDMPHGRQAGACGTEPDSGGTGVTGATTSSVGTQPPHPDADATPGRAAC